MAAISVVAITQNSVAAVTTRVSEYFCRCRGIDSAPATAPAPKLPKSRPKPPAPRPSWSRATTGSNAHSALAHTLKDRLRRMIARIGAECRAYRKPLNMPEISVSGTPGSAPSWRFQPRTTTIIAMKNAALASSVLPEPIHATSAPASAGPTARATLNATAPSATARGSSARATRSLMLACCAGM